MLGSKKTSEEFSSSHMGWFDWVQLCICSSVYGYWFHETGKVIDSNRKGNMSRYVLMSVQDACGNNTVYVQSIAIIYGRHFLSIDYGVKAYDTANHQLLIRLLEKYGAPPQFTNIVKRLYSNTHSYELQLIAVGTMLFVTGCVDVISVIVFST